MQQRAVASLPTSRPRAEKMPSKSVTPQHLCVYTLILAEQAKTPDFLGVKGSSGWLSVYLAGPQSLADRTTRRHAAHLLLPPQLPRAQPGFLILNQQELSQNKSIKRVRQKKGR